MTTDSTERGLERLISTALADHACGPETPEPSGGQPRAYGREYPFELVRLPLFLGEAQPEMVDADHWFGNEEEPADV